MARDGGKYEQHESNVQRPSGRANKGEAAGCWPCKINGCNKQFAREADLRRHQRTTKTHSMPGFRCPQCDATFTRTDALKRHQKSSRHNGLSMERPGDRNEGNVSGFVNSSSSSDATSDTSGSGALKYYRAHTVLETINSNPQPTAPKNTPSQLPLTTSDTQIWPSWNNDTSDHQAANNQRTYYSPYYRRNSLAPPSTRTTKAAQHRRRASLPASKITPLALPDRPPDPFHITNYGEALDSDPTIQPLLDFVLGDSNSGNFTEEQVIQITQAAVKAVLEAEAERLRLEGLHSEPSSTPPENGTVHPSETMTSHSMDHILTVDGEPMLNPADILTQESLASPPPL